MRMCDDFYIPASLLNDRSTTFWFLSGRRIRMRGGGTINGNGQVWYDALASGNGVRYSTFDVLWQWDDAYNFGTLKEYGDSRRLLPNICAAYPAHDRKLF